MDEKIKEIIEKIKSLFKKDQDAEGGEKKKPPLRIILMVAVVGLLAVTLFEDQEPEQQQPKNQQVAKVKQEAAPPQQPPEVTPKSEETVSVEESPPKSEVEEQQTETISEVSPDSVTVESNPETVSEAGPTLEGPAVAPILLEEKSNESPPSVEKMGEETANVEKSVAPQMPVALDQIQKAIESVEIVPTPTPIPVEVPPPNYRNTGRGLVYNCTQKHWSCVDRTGYFQCQNHQLWAKDQSVDPDCVIRQVYASDEDCQEMQQQQIDQFVKVNECTSKNP